MKQLLSTIALLLIISTSNGQYPQWANYTNGKDVLCLLNDGNYLWIGTTGGLVKMEKSNGNCIFFTKSNSGIPSNHVTSIDKDTQGNIWLTTLGAGVARFSGTNWTTWNDFLSLSHPYSNARAIFCHPNGSVWVGATGGTAGGVYRFLNNSWTLYGWSATSLHGWIESILADTNGVVYVGSNSGGMSRFDGTTWTNFNTVNSTMLNSGLHDLALDAQNKVWASSFNCGGQGGLSVFDGNNITTHLVNTSIEKIDFDAMGNLWFNKYPFSISKYDGTSVVNFDSTNSQITSVAQELLVDGSNIWYGTPYLNGLMKFDGISQVTPYATNQSGITYNTNHKIAADSNGVVWSVAYLTGIDRLDQNGFTNLNINNSSLPVPRVNSISVDPSNQLWMGSTAGVIKYDGTSFTQFDSATYNLIGSNIFHDPVFDNNGNVYCLFRWYYNWQGIKGGGGIMKYDGTNWTKINLSGIADTLIEKIAVDKQNNLWASGQAVIEKHSLINPLVFNNGNSPIALIDNFTSLLFDGNNNLWASTYNGKIIKIQNSQTFTSYNVTPCMFFPGYGDNISTMAIDRNNNLWLSVTDVCSMNGMLMAKFNGTSFTYFNVNNSGLSSQPSSITTAGNKIYMTTTNGIVIFTDPTLSTEVPEYVSGKSELSISPNPAQDLVNVTVHLNTSSSITVEVLNLHGQVVYSSHENVKAKGNHTLQINLGHLNNAIYFIRLKTDSGFQYAKLNLVK